MYFTNTNAVTLLTLATYVIPRYLGHILQNVIEIGSVIFARLTHQNWRDREMETHHIILYYYKY